MPQSNTGNWRVKDIPYGKGSLHGQTLEASVRHWRRAMKINEAENYKCNLTTSLLEKHHKAVENRKERTMESIRHSLEEMDAYREVLQSYRALNFRTMQRGFRAKPCGTPRCLLRYKLERRIYDCGFSVDTLKPEVTQIMETNKPEARRRRAHERRLAVARQRSEFLIQRNLTNQSLLADSRASNVFLPPISRERSVVHADRRLLR